MSSLYAIFMFGCGSCVQPIRERAKFYSSPLPRLAIVFTDELGMQAHDAGRLF